MYIYEEFKTNLLKETKKFLGEDAGLCIESILKNNGKKSEVITVKKEGILAVPMVHLDSLYSHHRMKNDLKECIDIVLDIMQKTDVVNQEAEAPSWKEISQNVKPCLVNLAWNQKRIEKHHLVYKEYMEFAIIFKVPMNNCDNKTSFYDVSYEMLEELGHTLEELYACAMNNLKQQKIRAFNIWEMTGNAPLEKGSTKSTRGNMYIATNESLKHGANVLLLEDFLMEFANEHDSDFVIFLSSIHELMLYFNRAGNTAEELRKMVREINEYSVSPEERLSNEVYCFKRETGKVELMK